VIAEHFTRRWQAAGLIDDELAQRIVAWENARRRPIFLWAIAGMGTLALGLGIMAIVGANWEAIPAWLKLATDLGLTALCAAAVFVCWQRDWPWRRELAALLLFALVLSGIALIGQVYQLQSEPWHALVLWLALCTPFLALTALSRLSGILWAIAVATTWFVAEAPLQGVLIRIGALPPQQNSWDDSYLLPLLSYLAACLMIMVAVLRGLWPPARGQADLLLRLALAGLAAACSLTMGFVWRPFADASPAGPIVAALVASLATMAVLWSGRPRAERTVLLAVVAASFAGWALALLVADTGRGNDLVRAVLFILYGAALGGLAARAGARGLFGFAFTMVGLRLLILYFEAIGGLTATGLGLIGGGLLCLLLAAIGWRLTRGVPRRSTGTPA
jgi:uncharacterized membrane protein